MLDEEGVEDEGGGMRAEPSLAGPGRAKPSPAVLSWAGSIPLETSCKSKSKEWSGAERSRAEWREGVK